MITEITNMLLYLKKDILKKIIGGFVMKNNNKLHRKRHRKIKMIEKKVQAIEALDEKMQALNDKELRAKTEELKKRLAEGESLDDILVEAFAVVREAADRTLHLKHYPVQLMGGIILHQGCIAEMKVSLWYRDLQDIYMRWSVKLSI